MALVSEIINEGCILETVYVDADDNIVSEAAIRQWKLSPNKTIERKYRCLQGSKAGKLVSNAGDCAKRKDPKKVRQGRKNMRSKKGIIGRKAKVSKRRSMNKMVHKMNLKLAGKA